MVMTANITPGENVFTLFEYFEKSVSEPSAITYCDLATYVLKSRGRDFANVSREHEQRFLSYMDRLSFFEPPCEDFFWLHAWNTAKDWLIDSGLIDPDNMDGSKEWHVLLLPTLGLRIGGNAVFYPLGRERDNCINKCAHLGKVWLNTLETLKLKPNVLLPFFSCIVVSDGETNYDEYFPAARVFLNRPASEDSSSWLLLKYLSPYSRTVNQVCCLELNHHARLKMLMDFFDGLSLDSVVISNDIDLI